MGGFELKVNQMRSRPCRIERYGLRPRSASPIYAQLPQRPAPSGTVLPSRVRYVGLLGPKKRSERLLQELDGAGVNVTAAQRRRLHAPIGLDIGAETSDEIALAIVAEITAALAGRAGGSLRERRTHIHERAPSEQVIRAQMVAVAP